MNAKQKQDNHETAQALWDACGRTNRVAGLGERLRSEKAASSRTPRPGRKVAMQRAHRKALDEAYQREIRHTTSRDPVPRYFPHQSDREMDRRVRQMETIKMRKEKVT